MFLASRTRCPAGEVEAKSTSVQQAAGIYGERHRQ
jgi:hypothetical protein